jgi:hydroxyacylglutathione hydrolase
MIFRQLFVEPIAAASYLIGCIAKGEAAIVDPGLPAEQYVTLAAEKGLRITAIFETHMHADYFSTARAIQSLTGATIYAPRLADIQFAHQPIDDGSEVHIGNIVIRALHTPGHTPEHMAYVVSDTPRSDKPWFVLTGDSLFVGDVGRVDLVSIPGTGTDIQYASMQKLLALPDYVEVFPGHFGGSACGGRAMSGKVSSTIGFERNFNWALQAPDEATFSAWLKQEVREAVESILMHRNTNRGELPLPAGYYGAHEMSASSAQMTQAQQQGAILLDVRATASFHTGFMPGAINIPFSHDMLPVRLSKVVPAGRPIVIYADTLVTAEAAKIIAEADGYRVIALSNAPITQNIQVLPAITIETLHAKVLAGAFILDVRETYEHAKGVIASAVLVPLLELATTDIPAEPLVIVCESGQRATIAASYLRQAGKIIDAVVYPGGMSDYLATYAEVHA